MRLDQWLVEQGLSESRNKAQELIKGGKVRLNAKQVSKPSCAVDAGDNVEVDTEHVYVSRAALKLKGFLGELPFRVAGMRALDIGASTGGFTEVLLEEGAVHVSAVDVGSDQLHARLRADARVSSIESTDIRSFMPGERFELVVSDVSFISLLHILDDVERLASKWIILLFKPQFEVGREAKRDRNGVVKEQKAITLAMERFEAACENKHWQLVAKSPSTLSGKEGNVEYCYCFKKD